MNILIVDDEKYAREGLASFLEQININGIVKTASDALEAKRMIQTDEIDLLFLDIEMPGINGYDLLELLEKPPATIIVSAYQKYAVDGYRYNVVDYIMKPFSLSRLKDSLQRAKGSIEAEELSSINEKSIFIKEENVYKKVEFESLMWVEAMQNYVVYQLVNSRILSLKTIKQCLKELPAELFMQVHRSYIVNLSKVKMVDGNSLRVGKQLIPVSRRLRSKVMKRLMG